MTTGNSNAGSAGREDLFRYLDAGKSLESTQAQLEALEESEAVETFHHQMALLQRRLLADPQAFRDMFIADGTNAIVWELNSPSSAQISSRRSGVCCCATTIRARC